MNEDLSKGGFFNMDCMQGMKEFEDNFFDLAIVDPPYGIRIARKPVRQKHTNKQWDDHTPDAAYFSELFRVSKQQIIWGAIITVCRPLKIILYGTRYNQKISRLPCVKLHGAAYKSQ